MRMERLGWPTKVAIAVAVGALLSGCTGKRPGKGSGEGSAAAGGPDRQVPVATVSGKVITVGQLKDELDRQNPFIRMRFSSLERKKAFLENMVKFEVLVREAERRELDKHPDVLRRMKRVMVNQLMKQLNEKLVKFSDITDEQAKAHYEKNIGEFRKPERVRASKIVVKTAAEAKALLAQLQKKPRDVRFFTELVAKHSVDAASKTRRGDLDFFDRGDKKIPRELIEATFSIKKMWGIAGPVKTKHGHAILMKTGHRERVHRPLKLVMTRIKNQLYNERRRAAIKDFIEKLRKSAKIKIIEKNLSKVVVKPAVPSKIRHRH